MASVTSEWRARHGELYARATTEHPYIVSIRDGSLHLDCYKRWLGQDYIFVKTFVRFLASIIAKTPIGTSDGILATLLGGMAALHDELIWFQTQASIWDIDLQHLAPQPAAQAYCRFLEDMSKEDVDYGVTLAALWTIEVVYCDSFASCLKSDAKPPPKLIEACNRWGNPSFSSYCSSLKDIVDGWLKSCTNSEYVAKAAEDVFVQVCILFLLYTHTHTHTTLMRMDLNTHAYLAAVLSLYELIPCLGAPSGD